MRKCPTCGAPVDQKTYPFCSSRCAEVDLGRWFQGKYVVPAYDLDDNTIVESLLAGNDFGRQDDDDC